MARGFNQSSTSGISATVAAIDTGDWTLIGWMRPASAGDGNVGRFLAADDGTNTGPMLRFNGSLSAFQAFQGFATTSATFTSSRTFTALTWYCVAGVFTAAGPTCALSVGTIAAAMGSEAGSSVSGVGVRRTSTVNFRAGCSSDPATGGRFNGTAGPSALLPWAMTLDEQERFRLGDMSVLFTRGAPRCFWPLTSPTLARAEDMSGNGAHGTVQAAVALAEQPPVPMRWAA